MEIKEKVSELFWLIMMVIQIIILAFLVNSIILAKKENNYHTGCSTLCCKAVSCDCKDNDPICTCKYINDDGVMKDTKCSFKEVSRSKQ